jgi:predicted nucleotidyltransferase
MTSSLPIHDVPAERPIAPQNVAMLTALNAVLADLNVDYIVAGATARDIVLWNLFGVKEERATYDVDIAVCALSWDYYDAAIAAVLASESFTQGKSPHTLLFQTPELKHAVPLDIIPFGELADSEGKIRWPPDGEAVMGVQGFEEAILHALRVRIAPDVVVLVTSPAALVILKVIAWSERGTTKNTDAPDILHIANSYDRVLGDKIWEDEALMVMADYDYDHSLTASRLLGKQAYAIADDKTRATLVELLKEDEAFEKFVIAATRTLGRGMATDSFEANKRLLEALRAGLLSG